MIHSQPRTLVAAFETRGQAETAIDDLWHAGFRQDQVGMATPGSPVRDATTPTGNMEKSAAQGAVAGSVAGGTVGAVLGGLAVGLIPGIGQVLAGGILAGIVTGAAAGAAGGAYLGPFFGLGLSDMQARTYEQHLRQGRTIVTVKTVDDEQALTILKSHGGQVTSTAGTVARV